MGGGGGRGRRGGFGTGRTLGEPPALVARVRGAGAPLIVGYDATLQGAAALVTAQAGELADRGYTCVSVADAADGESGRLAYAIALRGTPSAELVSALAGSQLPATVYLSPETAAAGIDHLHEP